MSSDNISIYEEYLFSANRQEFLDSCKNGSDFKKYIRICHLLNQQESKLDGEDRQLLDEWKRYNSGGDKRNLVIKDSVNSILREEDAAKRKTLIEEFNTSFLRLSFYDARQASGTQAGGTSTDGVKVQLKNALTSSDIEEMATITKIRQLENLEANTGAPFEFSRLSPNAKKRVDLSKIKNWNLLEQILNDVDNFAYSTVLKV